MMTLADIQNRRKEIAANPLFYCNKCQYIGPTSAHGRLSIGEALEAVTKGKTSGCNYQATDCNWREICALDALEVALKVMQLCREKMERYTKDDGYHSYMQGVAREVLSILATERSGS